MARGCVGIHLYGSVPVSVHVYVRVWIHLYRSACVPVFVHAYVHASHAGRWASMRVRQWDWDICRMRQVA